MVSVKNCEKEILFYKNALSDFKIPTSEQIAALMSFLNSAKDKINDEERTIIELSIKSGRYCLSQIDMLEDIYNIGNKNFGLVYENRNFLDLVDEAISDLGIILKVLKINIKYRKKENPIVKLDKNRIKTALESTFLSLFNYSKENITAYINIKTANERLIFEVSAKGRKIQQEEQKTMYDKYKNVPSIYCGTGLNYGMYLTKEIIARHFGQLILKSENNTNTFGFVLPIS